MLKYTYMCRIHTDAMNNRRRKTSLTKYLPLTLLQGFEKVVRGFTVRESWRPNITEIFWPPLLWPSVLCISRSSGLLNRRPRAHSARFWLSLLHLISIFSGPQLIRVPDPFGLVWLSLPHLVHLPPTVCHSTGRRTQLCYIIVRRPLDLWNRMFNRHQAEITVMQFKGHSLPVHHSVVAQWDLHLVPYYQP